jgi:hypothetical protein
LRGGGETTVKQINQLDMSRKKRVFIGEGTAMLLHSFTLMG